MKTNILYFIPLFFIFSCTHEPMIQEEIENNVFETIVFQDRVLDNGIPLEGAVVSIYGNDVRFSSITNAKGKYEIAMPFNSLPVEGFISLNIFHQDYQPVNITYEAPLELDVIYHSSNESMSMIKCENCLQIQSEKYSELFHLGDDNFSGTINSQFQKDAEGLEMAFDFQNTTSTSKLILNFEAKGIQPGLYDKPSKITFGSQTVLLDESPTDGSYGSYSIELDNESSIETVHFVTSEPRSTGDVDDWEFTSFFIRGID